MIEGDLLKHYPLFIAAGYRITDKGTTPPLGSISEPIFYKTTRGAHTTKMVAVEARRRGYFREH